MEPSYQCIVELERRHLVLDEAIALARTHPGLLRLEPWEIGAIEERKFQISAQIEQLLTSTDR